MVVRAAIPKASELMTRLAIATALLTVSLGTTNAQGRAKQATAAPSKPAPRTADNHPDLSGYWKNQPGTTPGGNIGKDLPGFKLPLTPAGEAALQHNLTATIDPESLCIIGGATTPAGSASKSCKAQTK